MKPKPTPHKTTYCQVLERVQEIWCAHPKCELPVGDIGPVVSTERVCIVMVARGPLMVCRRVPSHQTQFLFDAYGT